MRLTTEAELAREVLRIAEDKAADLRRTKKWPHVRLGRFDIRYTDAQIEQVVAIQSAAKVKAAVVASGQTDRSKARGRSA